METDRQFRDRTEAGEQLAEALREREIDADIALAIPRGGLPLGRAVADVLDVPLDIVVAKKIGAREIRSSLSVPSRATEVSGRTRRRSAERAVTRNTSSNSARRKRQTHVRKPNATETIRPNQT